MPEHFAAQEYDREHRTSAFGVCLEVSHPSVCLGGEADQPQKKRCKSCNQQQDFAALSTATAGEGEPKAPALVLEVAEALLDLHALGVEFHHARAHAWFMGQRGGDEPGVFVEFATATRGRTRAVGLERSPGSASGKPHQVERGAVGMFVRERAAAQVANPAGGLLVVV